MKIVVIGGSGRIGTRLVDKLKKRGHEAIAASPSTGVNTITGEGLAEALTGAQVVVDVTNLPSFDSAETILNFFTTSGRNLLAAEAAAGVKHHVALSVVGTERLLESGYFRAKIAQEKLIENAKIPYTIVRATQFFEFLGNIAQNGVRGERIYLSSAHFQPMAVEDVAAALADVALSSPVNGMIEIAGPERVGTAEMVKRYLKAKNDPREVVADPNALYFGVKLNDQSLTPGANPRLGSTRLEDWLRA